METDPIFRQLDKLLEKFSSNISVVKATRPINLLDEKHKFFDSKRTYNPQFQYRSLTSDTIKYHKQINTLLSQIPSSAMGKLYTNRLKECLIILDLINQIGQNSNKFTDLSIEIYGKPNNEYVKNAYQILQTPRPINTQLTHLTLKEITQLTQKTLQRYDLTFPIVIRKNTKNNLSITKLGKIKIPYRLSRTRNNLVISLEHEIGTHLLRFSNGQKYPNKIFQWGTAGYFKDEEGLAIVKSHLDNPQTILRKPALSLLATEYALEHSFCETFKHLYSISRNKKTCWNLTQRAKRGIHNTQEPGALTKDLYFQWAIETMQKILINPDLLNTAWNGKASLEELNLFTPKNPKINTSELLPSINLLLKANTIPDLNQSKML